jgi:Primosomal protein N'' (replication factor Y) - superfamily II helicase
VKEPRFYCEHCGVEVRRNAKVCPHCGHFFSSVKCPKCGYSGGPDDFDFGCPSCGYAVTANPPPEPARSAPRPAPRQKVAASPISGWVYAAAAAVLVALILALVNSLR